jgi:hypothetical protein
MDDFKKEQIKIIGCRPQCSHCNDFHGKTKNKLNKLARQKLKEDDRKNERI